MSTGTKSDFLKRAMRYCAGVEHCTQDVVLKLRSWKASEEEVDEIIKTLREQNFLDDTRYARAFVSDKWKLNLWGREKIRHGLLQKGIDASVIQNSLNTIDEEEYIKGLHQLLHKKRKELAQDDRFAETRKLVSFAASRGFEEELVFTWLESN